MFACTETIIIIIIIEKSQGHVIWIQFVRYVENCYQVCIFVFNVILKFILIQVIFN